MKKHAFLIAFGIGILAVLWVAAAVATTHLLVLAMTAVIGAVYTFGMLELRHFRSTTAQLDQALAETPEGLGALDDWLPRVPATLRNTVRQRIEGERIALPGPAFTPYLIGLLVMLGMLGTFLGMVMTLKGAVFALEGSSSVQGMRAAFTEPIRGLGLAFGTSVAGVATSAMLGLMSSLSRRERAQTAQTLDALMATQLRHFSLAHQRQETFRALQQQSQAMPLLVQQLQSLMTQMERHSQRLGDTLQSQQERFHQEMSTVYTGLARSVDASIRSGLSESMQLASDSIQPVVQTTLADMARLAQTQHEEMVLSTREQLNALQQQWLENGRAVSQTWSEALTQHAQRSTQQQDALAVTLEQFTRHLENRSTALVELIQSRSMAQETRQEQAAQQRLDAWTAALQAITAQLQDHWQQSGEHTLAQQQAICDTLTRTAQQVHSDNLAHGAQTLGEINRLLASHEEWVRARMAAESEAATQHTLRSEALAKLLRDELSALRELEAQRGDAAVARLAELQTAVTQHLSALGTALEAPIARLIETASEAPKAAAEVIGQLRQEISVSVARDNALLEERTRILETLSTLLDAIHHASTEQRGVIDHLVGTSQHLLKQASTEFSAHAHAETAKLGDIAAQVTASAVDVASLGETFAFAVRSFNETHEKLIANLQRIEAAIGQSMTRSDEQLAYYVAQAREIIDLSIGSQKEVLDALQLRQAQGAA